jgi:hypothetical protein
MSEVSLVFGSFDWCGEEVAIPFPRTLGHFALDDKARIGLFRKSRRTVRLAIA